MPKNWIVHSMKHEMENKLIKIERRMNQEVKRTNEALNLMKRNAFPGCSLILFLLMMLSNPQMVRSSTAPNGLCALGISTGQFGSLRLQSFTFIGPKQLVLLASGQWFQLPLAQLTGSSAAGVVRTTDQQHPVLQLARQEMSQAFAQPNQILDFTVVYTQSDQNEDEYTVTLVTNASVFVLNMFGSTASTKLEKYGRVEQHPNNHPYFSIASSSGQPGSEYVLQEDRFSGGTNQNPNTDTVMYSWRNGFVWSRGDAKLGTGGTPGVRYYFKLYLVPGRTDQVRLHKSNEPEISSDGQQQQLLHHTPTAFRHGALLYLFAPVIACVYVIDLSGLGQSSTVSRTNVPYEDFFQCPTSSGDDKGESSSGEEGTKGFPRERYPKDRCNQPNKWNPNSVTNKPDEASNLWIYLVVGLGAVLLLLLLVVFLIAVRKLRNRKPKDSKGDQEAKTGKLGEKKSTGKNKTDKEKKDKSKKDKKDEKGKKKVAKTDRDRKTLSSTTTSTMTNNTTTGVSKARLTRFKGKSTNQTTDQTNEYQRPPYGKLKVPKTISEHKARIALLQNQKPSPIGKNMKNTPKILDLEPSKASGLKSYSPSELAGVEKNPEAEKIYKEFVANNNKGYTPKPARISACFKPKDAGSQVVTSLSF